jgi:hypothetical protein
MQAFANRNLIYSRFPSNGVGAEIGVADGRNAWAINQYAAPNEFHLIDCWEQQEGEFAVDHNNAANHDKRLEYAQALFANCPHVIFHKSYSVPASQKFRDEYFDWIYIDANHMRNGFLADINAWWSKVKSGGIMAGHDYCMEKPNIEVKDALDEWMEQEKVSLAFITSEKYPSWAIVKS